jgi:uncharacterized protein
MPLCLAWKGHPAIINPSDTAHVRRKTDRLDAEKLAQRTKADVRALAREYALPVADKPANACLASRLPTGVRVTPERLAQVARAETALRSLGFPLVRVRHHGDLARIEVPREDVRRLRATEDEGRLEAIIGGAGFRSHLIDPEGYRPAGSRSREPLYSIAPQPDGGQ